MDTGKGKATIEEARDFVEVIIAMKQSFENEIPHGQRVLLNELALAGWYIDYGLAPETLGELLLADYQNKTVLNKYLVKYFKNNLRGISKNILSAYPKRSNILNAAFKAHKNKVYELSIPTMLSQIDGISYDMIEKDIFSRGRRKKKGTVPDNIPQAWVEQLPVSNFSKAMLEPLRNNTYISANFEESKNYYITSSRDILFPCSKKVYLKVDVMVDA